jgi:hypothetical protein
MQHPKNSRVQFTSGIKRFALLTTDANERARHASVADDCQHQLDDLLSAETVTADNPTDAAAEQASWTRKGHRAARHGLISRRKYSR